MRIMFLSTSQVQKLAVCCVEESNPKGKPNAHDPELDCTGEECADWIC